MSKIILENVTKTFKEKIALDKVSLSIPPGEIFGFLGPNGAGKSTTIRCIMGFIYPDTGNIFVNKEKVDKNNSNYRQIIGYVPSDLHLNDDWTASQHLEFISSSRNVNLNVGSLIERLNLELDTKSKHLSTGNRQKLGFLLALCVEPEVLILDEPTKGLDPILQEAMYEILLEFKNNGGSVFFSSHNLNEVERICDRVGIIRKGQIVANETINDLRGKKIHIVKASFIDEEVPDFSKFSSKIIVNDKQVEVHIEGDLNSIVREISKHNIADLTIEHASLEDVFLHFYEDKK
ncbi:MAG: ABC transporter ATP-binding protein [Acidimicrobiia bacterium]